MQDLFNHFGQTPEHEARRIALKKESKGEHKGIYNKYHAARAAQYGLSFANYIEDKDTLEQALEGHENMAEIIKVLGESINTEDNGFRNMRQEVEEGHMLSSIRKSDKGGSIPLGEFEDKGHYNEMNKAMLELWDEHSATGTIVDHLPFYLGDSRAWRNGFNAESFKRHVRKTDKARAKAMSDGAFCLIHDREEELARTMRGEQQTAARAFSKTDAGRQAKLDKLFAKQARRKAKR